MHFVGGPKRPLSDHLCLPPWYGWTHAAIFYHKTSGRLLNRFVSSKDKESGKGQFVIVHELVHLLIPNHGRVFKSFMYAYMPDWETRERRLQAHANKPTKKSKHIAIA